MIYKMAKKSVDDAIAKVIDNQTAFNPLLMALRANDKKNLFNTNSTTYFHKTGFPLFDFYFGSVINVHNDIGEIVQQLPRVGQAAGTFNMMIGNSGSGKTTLVMQMAANILRQYKNASVHHFDCEQRMDISRIETVTKLPIHEFGENGRYILTDGMISLDSMQEALVKLGTEKLKHKEEMTVETDQLDEFGKKLKIIAPSIVIIDSVAQLLSNSFSVDNAKDVADAAKMRGNMDGARDAKTLKGFFKDVLPICKKANIIIFGINHISANVNTNMFAGPTKQQNFLKADEAIPGGKNLIYNSFNIGKMTAKTADDFTEETDGFSGHMVIIEPIKSSSNQSGNNSKGVSFNMVFNYKHGFDSLRSLIIYGRDKGIIEGNKPRLKFKDDPSFTFAFKELDTAVNEHPIWENIKKYIIPELKSHLSFVEPESVKFDERSMDY